MAEPLTGGPAGVVSQSGSSPSPASAGPAPGRGEAVETSEDADALRRAEADLARVNRELRVIASAVSHELKEPARMVAGFLQLFRERYGDGIAPAGVELLDFAMDGARRMQELLDALVGYARVTSTPPQPVPLSGEHLLQGALDELRELVSTSGGEVTHDPLPRVVADEERVALALSHLLRNALTFRGAEPPRVHVSARQDGGAWVVSVADHGLGIAPEHHDEIFRLFRRLHARDAYPGHGVGLAVVRQIVEQHGGRVWVESELGRGAVFSFTLPAERVP